MRALPRASACAFTLLWLSPHAGDLQHVQQVLQPERSLEVAALVESVWPLLLHTTNRLAQQEQGETSRLSQEQVGCPCPFNVAFLPTIGAVKHRHWLAQLPQRVVRRVVLCSTGLN
jgi:hypothetical protein